MCLDWDGIEKHLQSKSCVSRPICRIDWLLTESKTNATLTAAMPNRIKADSQTTVALPGDWFFPESPY